MRAQSPQYSPLPPTPPVSGERVLSGLLLTLMALQEPTSPRICVLGAVGEKVAEGLS